MRGALIPQVGIYQVGGIIPAYAGSTQSVRWFQLGVRDHPRVCGEHCQGGASLHPPSGIIPAYAGSTFVAWAEEHADEDHPRVCGEHHARWHQKVAEKGSSPRMRGAPRTTCSTRCRSWIIPAYAGSTAHEVTRVDVRRDHPRVCGEHAHVHYAAVDSLGSSPRMRGAPLERP